MLLIVPYRLTESGEKTNMNSISANDLKTKGVSAIERALADQPEVSLTVRGQAKYVVMSREQYAHLRECELEAALAESKTDLDAGRFVKESVEKHITALKWPGSNYNVVLPVPTGVSHDSHNSFSRVCVAYHACIGGTD